MMRLRRAPGQLAGWVCLLATLLHMLAFVVHTGRAATAAPAGIAAALAGALCAGSERLPARAFAIDGDDEERPGLAAGCPICTAGASIHALPAPGGVKIVVRPARAAPSTQIARSGVRCGCEGEATPIRGPPATRFIA